MHEFFSGMRATHRGRIYKCLSAVWLICEVRNDKVVYPMWPILILGAYEFFMACLRIRPYQNPSLLEGAVGVWVKLSQRPIGCTCGIHLLGYFSLGGI